MVRQLRHSIKTSWNTCQPFNIITLINSSQTFEHLLWRVLSPLIGSNTLEYVSLCKRARNKNIDIECKLFQQKQNVKLLRACWVSLIGPSGSSILVCNEVMINIKLAIYVESRSKLFIKMLRTLDLWMWLLRQMRFP
jgi:hypothetical protein